MPVQPGRYEVRIYKPPALDTSGAESTHADIPLDFGERTSCIEHITTEVMSRAEFRRIDLTPFDFIYLPCFAYLCFRTANGQRIRQQGKWRKFGPATIPMLETLMSEPGTYCYGNDVAAITGIISMKRKKVFNVNVARLRGALHESGKHQHFIQTSDIGVAWNEMLSYIWVTKVLP